MSDYRNLTKAQLIARLEALQAATDKERTAGGAENLLHELQVHQIELEMQNRKLRDRETRLRAVLDTVADAIITTDQRGIVQHFNPAAERTFGYSAAEVIGRNVRLLMPSPYREEHDGYIRRYLHTRVPHIIGIGREAEGRRKDGSVFPLELAVTEAPSDELYFIGIIRDITARKAAETALRESEERLRQLAEHIQEVFWMTSLDEERVIYVSPAYETLWGRSREALYADPRHWLEAVHPEDRPRVQAAFEAALTAHVFDQEYRIVRPDGAIRWIHDRGFPIRDAAGRVHRIAGLAADLTERKHLEEQLQRRQAELAHATRLSLAGEMASGLAHELNQPLMAIVTYAQLCQQLLAMTANPLPQLGEILGKIVTQGKRGGEIIGHLRRLVTKAESRQAAIDINALIRDAVRFDEIEIREQEIALRLQLAERLPRVAADAIQIEQVVLNLIRNAVEAMKATEAGRRELVLQTATGPTAAEVEVAVTDTGPGLPAKDAEKLFHPFFTTKPNGMGLGLAICRSIIETHGGRLWAMAAPERGATFHFTLPAAKGG